MPAKQVVLKYGSAGSSPVSSATDQWIDINMDMSDLPQAFELSQMVPPEILEYDDAYHALGLLKHEMDDIHDYWYAHLMVKTDFTEDEISKWLQHDPDERNMELIQEFVEVSNRMRELAPIIQQNYPGIHVG